MKPLRRNVRQGHFWSAGLLWDRVVMTFLDVIVTTLFEGVLALIVLLVLWGVGVFHR